MLNNCHDPDAIREDFPTHIPTVGELLRDHGYRTGYVGKWHVGRNQSPEDFGFEYLGGGDDPQAGGESMFYRYQRAHGVDPANISIKDTVQTSHDDPKTIAGHADVPKEATRTYYLADLTIAQLEHYAHTDDPFFHRTDFVGPHHPYIVPEPYASMYNPDEIERWASFKDSFENKPRVQELYQHYRGVADLSWDEWAKAIAKYFGFVTFVDDQIGRILDAVEELGLEDAIVVHTSDHGDFTGSHGQFNKGPMMYEETYRIPLIMRWPDIIEPGTTHEAFVSLLDLMPTLLDIADVKSLPTVDGRSLRPLLKGEPPADWPGAVFGEYHGDEFGLYSQRMVRTDRYKYIYNAPDIDEMYDLERDPHELENRINDPEYREVRREMIDRLLDWMDRTDDSIRQWTPKAIAGSVE